MECDGSITMEVVDEEEFILELPAVTHGVEYNGVSDLRIMLKAKPDEVRVDGLRTDVDESKFPEEILSLFCRADGKMELPNIQFLLYIP